MLKHWGWSCILVVLAGCFGEVAEPGASTPPSSKPAEEVEVADLFAGDMPDVMVDAHARQLGGDLLEPDVQRELFAYAERHPHDARPWLLLARDSMQRSWPGFAMRQYRSAIEADPRA